MAIKAPRKPLINGPSYYPEWMVTLLKTKLMPSKKKKIAPISIEKISPGDLLYHSAHGLCRVQDIIKKHESSKNVSYVSLVPKLATQMKIRFEVPLDEIVASGFHAPVTFENAEDILDYLKSGDLEASPELTQDHQTWALAKTLLEFSNGGIEAKDQRKRQILERSVNGLVRELSFVMKITVKETVAKVRKSLDVTAKNNPLIMAALTHATEE